MSDTPLRIPQSAGEGAVASLERLGVRILGVLARDARVSVLLDA